MLGKDPKYAPLPQLPLSLSKEKRRRTQEQGKYIENNRDLIINFNTCLEIHPVYSDCY